MILSTPFSRHQTKGHQSWANGSHSLGRKPAPQQPAPKPDVDANCFRSQTLSRLELQRARQKQQQQQQAKASLRRNLASLGHYKTATSNSNNGPEVAAKQPPIYAPASIASPREFSGPHRQQHQANGLPHNQAPESQHYAATSFRYSNAAPSESGRSGRESALGNLLERFGTLRRRARWSRSSKKTSQATPRPLSQAGSSDYATPSFATPNGLNTPQLFANDDDDHPEARDGLPTGGRKIAEAEAIYAEGLRAIDGNIKRRLLEHELNESIMQEGETRTIIEEESRRQPDYQLLITTLTNWINDELSQQRIIVKDLQDDLYDGQILGNLIEKLHKIKLDIVEVTQNEATQRYKLRTVLETINRILRLQARWARIRWSVEGIHGKNMVEIIHLLATLARYYRAPLKLPADVRVRVLVVQKSHNQLVKRSHEAQLTDSSGPEIVGADQQQQQQRDVFDSLFEFAPDKLAIVKQSLVRFVNRHLNKVNISCSSSRAGEVLDPEQFADGLLLVFLIASLEDYFVPLGNLFTEAKSVERQKTAAKLPIDVNNNNDDDNISNGTTKLQQTAIEVDSYTNTQPIHKLHNVNFALQLMEEAGIAIRQRVRAEDIVNGDLKSVMRVLYALFSSYKHV